MTRPLRFDATLLIALTSTFVLACPSEPSGDTTSSATETGGDGDGDPTTGDGDGDPATGDGDGDPATGDGDGDGDPTSGGDEPPVFVNFTVNGSGTPGLVESASAVVLEAEVSDPDDDIAYLVFRRNGEILTTDDSSGPNYSFELLVSGEEFNGEYSFVAEVYDDNDNMATSETINLALGMPPGGGEIEAWTHDSGNLDASYDIVTNPEGDLVVVTGQTTVDVDSQIRTDRVIGDTWTDKSDPGSIYGASITARDAGGYFVTGATPGMGGNLNSLLIHYAESGSLIDITMFDGSSQPAMANDIDNTIAAGRAPNGVWVMGGYIPSGGPNSGDWNTYIRRYTDDLDLEYERLPSEDLPGRPFAYDMDTANDGSLALAGGQFAQMPVNPWFATFDETGNVVDQTIINSFDSGILHAVALGDDGSIVVGGQVTTNGVGRSFLRSYDQDGMPIFEVEVPNSELGVVAALAIDPWGEIVSVSTEGCTTQGFRYVDCNLFVRKYDREGNPMWQENFGPGFLGPNLILIGFDASIDIDRYGYIYVTAIPEGQDGTDWWARKLQP